jgi:hypothetical protein
MKYTERIVTSCLIGVVAVALALTLIAGSCGRDIELGVDPRSDAAAAAHPKDAGDGG